MVLTAIVVCREEKRSGERRKTQKASASEGGGSLGE